MHSPITKFIILLFLIFNVSFFSSAQKQECGTVLPHDFQLQKDKNPELYQKFLENFEENYLNRPVTAGSCMNDIPMKVHIIRRSNGTGGLTVSQLNTAMTTLNQRYQAACMVFYICGNINYIDSDTFYDFDESEEAALTSANNVANAINIYYANSVGSGSTAYCGYAYYPGGADVIMMDNSCALNGSTLPHEVGHFFNLPHTHSGGGELVNGSNCTTNGDRFCDTPADPTLGSGNVNSSCAYIGTTTDANGDLYVPDPINIMSYSRKACRTFFSPKQLAEIAFNSIYVRNYFQCADFGVDFTADVTQSCTFPLTVNFTESASGENSYEWDFDNDGTVDATIANPSHTYTSAGSYEVSLTVSDGTNTIAKVRPSYIEIGAQSFPQSNDLDNFSVSSSATGFKDGWTANPSGTTSAYRWNTRRGSTPSNSTGPAEDQSLGSPFGIYIFSEASDYNTGDIAELISPCLDIPINTVDPSVSFYYHMYGVAMGTLHIDLYDGTNWINDITTAIVGQQQTNMSDPWIEKTFDVSAYKGAIIQIRFRAERGNGYQSDMAIDNLQLLELSPLPVELVKFEGNVNKKGEHLLDWQTASEENASHFLLEHSKDGIQFETLEKIATKGNSTTTFDYRFINYYPSSSGNYYRLQIVDLDGTFEYSSIVYLPFTKQDSEVSIFPNPSSGHFKFHRSKENGDWDLLVYNSIGQIIKSTKWKDGAPFHDLSLDSFSKGIYTVQILNRNKIIGIRRLIKL